MIPDLRERFNRNFQEDTYKRFLRELDRYAGERIPFRIAETPVFVPASLRRKLEAACNGIIDFITRADYKSLTDRAIPAGMHVPGNEGHSMWLAFDFAVCRDSNYQLAPKLIEMQGFPSLFYYQHVLAQHYRSCFDIDDRVTHLFGRSGEAYLQHMNALLLNGHKPENVILLEVEPEKQNTRIDFLATYKHTGIKPVCVSTIRRSGRNLYYESEGNRIPVHRIYNRVIFDEFVKRKDLSCEFNLTEDVDVEWAGHPNWFFRISKFTMPFLEGEYVPETKFLSDVKSYPADPENFVLKPLFSFSGSGVKFHVKHSDLASISDPWNWILQRKVSYEPVIPSPDGDVKTEIRMLYSWEPGSPRPSLVMNMARLSKGEMIGVKYNRNKTWVGGSIGFFES